MERLALILLDNYFTINNIEDKYEETKRFINHYGTNNVVELVNYLAQDSILPFGIMDFDNAQIAIIKNTLANNLDVTLLLNPKLNELQMKEIMLGLMYNQKHDVDHPYTWLLQTPDGSALSINVKSYADPKYTASEMRLLRLKLQHAIVDTGDDDYEEGP